MKLQKEISCSVAAAEEAEVVVPTLRKSDHTRRIFVVNEDDARYAVPSSSHKTTEETTVLASATSWFFS